MEQGIKFIQSVEAASSATEARFSMVSERSFSRRGRFSLASRSRILAANASAADSGVPPSSFFMPKISANFATRSILNFEQNSIT